MKLTSAIAALLAYGLLALSQDIRISVPHSELPLNLSDSASVVKIEWSMLAPLYSHLDLQFRGPDFGLKLASIDIANLEGSILWTWEPRAVIAALQARGISATKDPAYYFRGWSDAEN